MVGLVYLVKCNNTLTTKTKLTPKKNDQLDSKDKTIKQ